MAFMFCVGFVEEVFFRGLLFKTLEKGSGNMAIVISSSAFANEEGLTMERRMIFHGAWSAITVGYTFVFNKTLPKKTRTNGNVQVDR